VRYLRLDQKVEGYARLSPSILREFLTYTVVGPAGDPVALEAKARALSAHIQTVSSEKLALAQRVVSAVTTAVAGASEQCCVLLAGDIVYQMAHDVPRPERSTGQMVRGSDVDLVVVVQDDAPQDLVDKLDQAIYQQKYRQLINPSVREEIDYIVKRFERLREQMRFADFKSMVACKILDESVLLSGDPGLFAAAKGLLREHGVDERLAAMQAAAVQARKEAETYLLSTEQEHLVGEELSLFYTVDESEEFE